MVMKKLFSLILAIVCSMAIADAQNTLGTNKVTLKNGSVIEGSVTTQGDDIIVTTSNGDMFYYSRSEISSITSPKASDMPGTASSSMSFREYKKAAKSAWRDVKTTEFWGENATSLDYYKGYKRRTRLSLIFCCSGVALTIAGKICWDDGILDEEAFIPGPALFIAGCILTAPANAKLRRSYEYYDNYGKGHAVNVSATPVVYAQGGAGLGVRINF